MVNVRASPMLRLTSDTTCSGSAMAAGTTFHVSQMGWTQTCPNSEYDTNTNNKVFIHYPNATIPANQNIIANGDFGANSLLGWWSWGDVATAFYGDGVLHFKRKPPTRAVRSSRAGRLTMCPRIRPWSLSCSWGM